MKQHTSSAPAATIREIARRAEVSIASVSRALNGKPGLSDALRERILAEQEKAGFVPEVFLMFGRRPA